ncbi:MAG TPA: hypothetical protein VH044_11455 [Polyangiaceae bacterium]|nr:hypothetical protein [Polyangiaceae bacterium]
MKSRDILLRRVRMGQSGFLGSRSRAGVAGAVLVLALAHCGSGSDQKSTSPDDGPLVDCQAGATTPCSSYTDPVGNVTMMGPAGAIMEPNVGKGFENVVQSSDVPGNESMCQTFASVFMEDPKLTAQLLNTNQNGVNLDFALYTVYRPAKWPAGKTLPVLTWGNGTCAQPEGYGALLRYVASYGYFVVAANSRQVGAGTPQPMLNALTFAAAANADPASPYYQKLDLTKVGAFGHSQGGAAAQAAAMDARVKDAIIFNAVDSDVAKPYLAISGDTDITGFSPSGMASAINASPVPAAWLYYHNPAGMGPIRGHLVLMLTPGRVTAPTVAWWQMAFDEDTTSQAMFVGAACGLCTSMPDYEFGEQGLPLP